MAEHPFCGTSPVNDARARALHARMQREAKPLAGPQARTIVERDGTFVVPNDAAIAPGYRPFDLEGQSLVFTPAGASAFTTKRTPLQYREPGSLPLRDFAQTADLFVQRDLGFTFPIYGRSVTRIFISAQNGITFEAPVVETALQFATLDAAVHRQAIVSPLLLTSHAPAALKKPRVFVDERPGAVVVTWRSSGGVFSYDIQAELTAAGAIAFSYRSVAMKWGAPLVSPGFDPLTATRTVAFTKNDGLGVTTEVRDPIRAMVDIEKLEVVTFDDAELFAIRLTLGGAIDRTQLRDDETFGFFFVYGESVAGVELTRDAMRVQAFDTINAEEDGAAAFVDGKVIEMYALRRHGVPLPPMETVGAVSYALPYIFFVDDAGDRIRVPAAARTIVSDFSALPEAGAARTGVITEPFLLGQFDPYAVWEKLQTEWGLSDEEYDAVAMYQNFHTDLIFFASAYAIAGNPQVDGISFAELEGYGTGLAKAPTLMHMNHLTYDFSAAEKSASQVLLHEFGHRWLYYLEAEIIGEDPRVLNPVSAHPAAYVHTPSVFAMHGPNEASVMGGGFFTPLGGGSYRVTAANYGYSWVDLYAMGLADASEVASWFFLNDTDLPLQYFPPDGVTVTGNRRDVTIDAVRRELGFRQPSTVYAPRVFRVLFVLVTEEGRPATETDLATMRSWRSVLERDFTKATGKRGVVQTSFARPTKKRAAGK